ncbi:MAG: M14 family zinc carboxypeptidase [Candidatus Zixiibacteriota bacterium]
MNKPIFLLLAVLSIAAISASAGSNMQARIYLQSGGDLHRLFNEDMIFLDNRMDFIEIATDEAQLERIQSYGFQYRIINDNLAEYITTGKIASGETDYKTLAGIYASIDSMISQHSGMVSKDSIGLSFEGRPLWAVKISDNVGSDEDEPEILYTALTHANEAVTAEVLLYFMNYLTDNYSSDTAVTSLVDSRELWFIVVVNPDGYYYNREIDTSGYGDWRKNRRGVQGEIWGVDLNRNYGYKWGPDYFGSSGDSNSIVYRGTEVFSEPETQCIDSFICAHDFMITVDYHSYGNKFMWSWGYLSGITTDNDIFWQIGDSIHAMNNYAFYPLHQLYFSNGTSVDWSYGEQTAKNKAFAVTFEIGSSFWPNPELIDDIAELNIDPNFYLAKVASDLYSLRAPNQPCLVVPLWTDDSGFTISWSLTDTLNPAEAYELVELTGYNRTTDQLADIDLWDSFGFSITEASAHSGSTGITFDDTLMAMGYNYIQTKNPLAVKPDDTLKFWTRYNLLRFGNDGHFSYGYVEVSTDGHDFVSIPGNITTTDNPYGLNPGYAFTGVASDWTEAKFNLDDYAGQDIWIRISSSRGYYSSTNYFYIDDISPVVYFESSTVVASDLTDSGYTFSGKLDGTYYYRIRARDAEDQWGVISESQSILVYDSDCCVGIRGNVDNDQYDQITISDLIYLIDYLVNYGPVPECPPEANVDGSVDGIVDESDMYYLVNYMFYGGPAPDSCD